MGDNSYTPLGGGLAGGLPAYRPPESVYNFDPEFQRALFDAQYSADRASPFAENPTTADVPEFMAPIKNMGPLSYGTLSGAEARSAGLDRINLRSPDNAAALLDAPAKLDGTYGLPSTPSYSEMIKAINSKGVENIGNDLISNFIPNIKDFADKAQQASLLPTGAPAAREPLTYNTKIQDDVVARLTLSPNLPPYIIGPFALKLNNVRLTAPIVHSVNSDKVRVNLTAEAGLGEGGFGNTKFGDASAEFSVAMDVDKKTGAVTYAGATLQGNFDFEKSGVIYKIFNYLSNKASEFFPNLSDRFGVDLQNGLRMSQSDMYERLRVMAGLGDRPNPFVEPLPFSLPHQLGKFSLNEVSAGVAWVKPTDGSSGNSGPDVSFVNAKDFAGPKWTFAPGPAIPGGNGYPSADVRVYNNANASFGYSLTKEGGKSLDSKTGSLWSLVGNT